MEANTVSVLPAEMLTMILQWLAMRDLKEAVLVSRRLRELAEAPELWAALVHRFIIRPVRADSDSDYDSDSGGPGNIDFAVEVVLLALGREWRDEVLIFRAGNMDSAVEVLGGRRFQHLRELKVTS
jgi:hypothetical protein